MTDTELKKLIEDCCDDIFNRLEPLANVKSRLYESLKPAINYTRCCDKLKDKTELNFELWLKENGYAITDEGYINNEITFSFGEMHKIYNDYLKTL